MILTEEELLAFTHLALKVKSMDGAISIKFDFDPIFYHGNHRVLTMIDLHFNKLDYHLRTVVQPGYLPEECRRLMYVIDMKPWDYSGKEYQ